ncbi:hypothetical protein Q8A67_018170 [Cirrhinus molitorella]|uniref:Uncharacterized protein n=1 Tax=Cirrhinus molitorella TaxID=172907 RepID=A0AA88TFV8_9TELE|nr:hypothetical protein Q8A67_018170 [Cirrhinus molitorella]
MCITQNTSWITFYPQDPDAAEISEGEAYVHYCFCLVAKHPFECSITIINGRLSRLGFEDLYTNTVCFTSPRPWSSEERLPSSCPGQGEYLDACM